MPILQTIFPENTSITIPLLIYHPMQIILGNYLTPVFQRWLKDAKYEWFVAWIMSQIETDVLCFLCLGIIKSEEESN